MQHPLAFSESSLTVCRQPVDRMRKEKGKGLGGMRRKHGSLLASMSSALIAGLFERFARAAVAISPPSFSPDEEVARRTRHGHGVVLQPERHVPFTRFVLVGGPLHRARRIAMSRAFDKLSVRDAMLAWAEDGDHRFGDVVRAVRPHVYGQRAALNRGWYPSSFFTKDGDGNAVLHPDVEAYVRFNVPEEVEL